MFRKKTEKISEPKPIVNEKMEKYKMVYIYSYMYIVCMKKKLMF